MELNEKRYERITAELLRVRRLQVLFALPAFRISDDKRDSGRKQKKQNSRRSLSSFPLESQEETLHAIEFLFRQS